MPASKGVGGTSWALEGTKIASAHQALGSNFQPRVSPGAPKAILESEQPSQAASGTQPP